MRLNSVWNGESIIRAGVQKMAQISNLTAGCNYTWVWAYLKDSLDDAFTMSDRIHDRMLNIQLTNG